MPLKLNNNIFKWLYMHVKDMEFYAQRYGKNFVEESIKSFSNKWTLHIFKDLFQGKSRFTEFQKDRPNLDNKALVRCLNAMRENGLIEKKNDEYFLTKKGFSFNKVYFELVNFSIENDSRYSSNEKLEIKNYYSKLLKL